MCGRGWSAQARRADPPPDPARPGGQLDRRAGMDREDLSEGRRSGLSDEPVRADGSGGEGPALRPADHAGGIRYGSLLDVPVWPGKWVFAGPGGGKPGICSRI